MIGRLEWVCLLNVELGVFGRMCVSELHSTASVMSCMMCEMTLTKSSGFAFRSRSHIGLITSVRKPMGATASNNRLGKSAQTLRNSAVTVSVRFGQESSAKRSVWIAINHWRSRKKLIPFMVIGKQASIKMGREWVIICWPVDFGTKFVVGVDNYTLEIGGAGH